MLCSTIQKISSKNKKSEKKTPDYYTRVGNNNSNIGHKTNIKEFYIIYKLLRHKHLQSVTIPLLK